MAQAMQAARAASVAAKAQEDVVMVAAARPAAAKEMADWVGTMEEE